MVSSSMQSSIFVAANVQQNIIKAIHDHDHLKITSSWTSSYPLADRKRRNFCVLGQVQVTYEYSISIKPVSNHPLPAQ